MTPVELVHHALSLVRHFDIGFIDCFSDDGAVAFPFAPAGMAKRVEGRAALRAMYAPRYQAMRSAGRPPITFDNLTVHETKDPEVVIAEYEASGSDSRGGQLYRLPFIQVFRIRDGRIIEQRDYFDSNAMAQRLQPT